MSGLRGPRPPPVGRLALDAGSGGRTCVVSPLAITLPWRRSGVLLPRIFDREIGQRPKKNP